MVPLLTTADASSAPLLLVLAAVLGAVTGTASLLLALWKAIADTPRLKVDASSELGKDGIGRLHIDVVNVGRQPIGLWRAGFYVHTPETGDTFMRLDVAGLPAIGPGDPPIRLTREVRTYPEPIPAALPLRPYALDARDNMAWGAPFALLRDLLELGWDPPAPSDPTLLVIPESPLVAHPVERRWKVWKPKHVRAWYAPVHEGLEFRHPETGVTFRVATSEDTLDLASGVGVPQEANTDNDAQVSDLPPGTPVLARLSNGDHVTGELKHVTESGIVLETDQGQRALGEAEVDRVFVYRSDLEGETPKNP
jgi:hypothetical protein